MLSIRFLIILLLLAVTKVSQAQMPVSFRGIVPLVTTRAQVEDRIGKEDEHGRYELPEGRVYILYRETPCKKADLTCSCLAGLDVVRAVDIQPEDDLYIKNFNFDSKLWRRSVVTGHVSGIEVYINDKLGIVYEFESDDGYIRAIRYWESEETCKKLESARRKKRP